MRRVWLFACFLFALSFFNVPAEEVEQSCDDLENTEASSVDNNQQQKQLQEVLRRLVQGYVRSEKTSHSSILDDVNILMKDKLPAEAIEEVVKEAVEDNFVYADQLVRNMLETVADPDCMSREFDASQPNFNATRAASVMHKCKLLVLRNVFDMDILKEFKADFTAYVRGLDSGRIPKTGSTTNNEAYFMDKLDYGRWELLIPQDLAYPEVVRNENVMRVLVNERLLGPNLVLHSMGAAIADTGAKPQDWHTVSVEDGENDRASQTLFSFFVWYRTATTSLETDFTRQLESHIMNFQRMQLP